MCAMCTVKLDDSRMTVFHSGSHLYQAAASENAMVVSAEVKEPLLAIGCAAAPPTASCGVRAMGQLNSKPGHSRPFMRPPSPSPASQGPTRLRT